MRLSEILTAAGHHPSRKRRGRGTGSGHGKTSGRGTKGRGARSGATRRLNYEGGQNPVLSRIPKRGFSNFRFRKDVQIVNVADLEQFEDGARVDAAALVQAGVLDNAVTDLKVLGGGELTKKLTVVAAAFSAAAAEKITKAGGSVQTA